MELKKNIGKVEVVSLALGSIIGSGAFILPGDLFLKKLGLYNTIIGLLLGAISILVIEKNYGYLINKFPNAGGEYIFAKEALGKKYAFFCAWFLLLAYTLIIPLNATALSVGVNTVLPGFLHWGFIYKIAGYPVYMGEVLLALFFLFLFAFLNIKNVKIATLVQNVMVFFLVGIILFFASVLIMSKKVDTSVVASHLDFTNFNIGNILKTMIIAPFLFVGFDCIPQIAEELNFEAKKASVLAMISIMVGAFLYIAITFSTAFGFTVEQLQSGGVNWATGDTIEIYFGKIGLLFLVLAFFTAIIAGINGFYMAASRLVLAMAREGDLPSWLGEIDGKAKTPKYAVLFCMLISLMAPWVGRRVLLWIVDMSSLGAIIAYLFTSISAFVIYKKEYGKISKWSVAGTIISVIFIFLMLLPNLSTSLGKESYIALVIWSLIGFVFFSKKSMFDIKSKKSYNNLD